MKIRSVAIVALGLMVAAIGRAEAQVSTSDKALHVITLQTDSAGNRPPVFTAVAISPDGQLVAGGGDDHMVRIWSLADGKLLHTINGHNDWLRSLTFSPNGQTL